MGFFIIIRYILKTLLEKCKDSGKVSEMELYFYLFYFANYSEYPNKVKKRNIFVLEHKGQIAVSAEELSQYFKVARNTITARLKGLIDDGFVKIVSNSKVCNVYEIVSYGDTKFMIEQLKPIDISNENGNFSKVVEQQKKQSIEQLKPIDISNENGNYSKDIEQQTQNFEQLNEQLKTQIFEQQKKQSIEQLKPIDISIKNGNYSKDIEQPKTQDVEQLNEQPKTQNVEQLYLNNINNINLIPTTISLSTTREKNFLDEVKDNKDYFNWLNERYNIDWQDIESKFDNFYVKQMEDNKSYKSADEVKYHFVQWFDFVLKQCYGNEIFETFKRNDSKNANPKRLKNPMRYLTSKQINELSKGLGISPTNFKKRRDEFIKDVADDYRFSYFAEELNKLMMFIKKKVNQI